MKYIIFEDFSGKPVPIIFPERITFEEMREQMPYSAAISGGRVWRSGQDFACDGVAGNLGLTHRDVDAEIIAAFFENPEEPDV